VLVMLNLWVISPVWLKLTEWEINGKCFSFL
jgi:hypothetical protein